MAKEAGAGRAARDLRLVVAAHAVSTYGSYLNLVALGLFVLALTGSAMRTGLFMAVRLVAGFLMGPVSGLLAGRCRRTRLMIGADVLSALTLTLLVVAPVGARPAMLYALAVVLGCGQTLWGVALRAELPDLVGPQRRARANARLVAARSVAMLLGFASAGFLVAGLGYEVAFLLDAGTYALSALLLARVPARRPAAAPGAAAPVRPQALAGFGVLRAVAPVVAAMIGVRAADAFGSAAHNVGIPVQASLVQPDSPAAYAAVFMTSWAVGSLAAGRWCARVAARTGGVGSPRAFGVATCLMSLFFVLAFTDPPLWLLIPLTLAAGAADGYAEINYTTRLQGVDESRRARLFGFASAAQNAGFGLGMIGCAAALGRSAPLTVVAVAHGLACAVALGFLLAQAVRPADRHDPPAARTDRADDPSTPRVAEVTP
ncbi:MFS transporter [Micromonospora sp. KC207]|uniref:MFS transporter n=1 Tax=Micromonospora sp. KC207 TaxID=2530377 RepID=UPI00140461FC|nr:MFS transporter [Micromonospora sp. KC207]